MEYYSAIKKNSFESVLMRWMKLEPIIQSEVSQKEKHHRLVAHNTACEKTVLTRLAPLTRWGPWVDTLKLAKARFPGLPSYRLGDLCAAFGCVPQMAGRTWHDGLYDAVACANLACRLTL